MRILAVGDVVGGVGLKRIKKSLPQLKREKGIDLCIVNGENACRGRGLDREAAETLFSYGADVITGGNHIWDNFAARDLLEETENIIRPANYPAGTPGRGYTEIDMIKHRICIINLLGRVGIDPVDCPFRCADKILSKTDCDIIIVDFHAEATSEKIALARYLDGRVTAVFGTHTHVETADEEIFPGGTGYITDIGMTGAVDSVLGMKTSVSISRFVNKLPARYEEAGGDTKLCGIIFETNNGKCVSCERIKIR